MSGNIMYDYSDGDCSWEVIAKGMVTIYNNKLSIANGRKTSL